MAKNMGGLKVVRRPNLTERMITYLSANFDEQVYTVPSCSIHIHYNNYLNSKIIVNRSVNEVVHYKPAIKRALQVKSVIHSLDSL